MKRKEWQEKWIDEEFIPVMRTGKVIRAPTKTGFVFCGFLFLTALILLVGTQLETWITVDQSQRPRVSSFHNWSATSTDLDWLHIPKTGTSFVRSLLLHQCDSLLAVNQDPEWEEIMVSALSDAVNDGKGPDCAKGLRYFHWPLRRGNFGHKAHRPEDVVTILRHPAERIPSGLVFDMIQCRISDSREICKALLDPNTPAERVNFFRSRVVAYANCVSGCSARMILGGVCSHQRSSSPGNITRMLPKVASKMQRFAFVGLTDRWSESMCLWAKRFKRQSGAPYTRYIQNKNIRPTVDRQCEIKVQQVLEEEGFEDHLDTALYNLALDRFEKELERYPECKEVS